MAGFLFGIIRPVFSLIRLATVALPQSMNIRYEEIRFRGKDIKVPSAQIDGRIVVVARRWPRIASVKDEELVEGGVVPDPASFISKLKISGLKIDILTFPQAIYESNPKYDYPYEMDNAAVASTANYDAWWEGLPQESRKNARRAIKRGVCFQVAELDDDFIKGIKRIYDESPIRQGMRFWHYRKSLDRVRLENATYPERSEFIGAYFKGELIGFMKWVYVDKVAQIMQILSMSSHYDKRPMNGMIAKAVEVCHQKGIQYLVYSKFTFGNKTASQLSDFKRRNGFLKMNFPRYFVPLTSKGHIVVKLGLHRGLLGVLPPRLIGLLWAVRGQAFRLATRLGHGRGHSGNVANK